MFAGMQCACCYCSAAVANIIIISTIIIIPDIIVGLPIDR